MEPEIKDQSMVDAGGAQAAPQEPVAQAAAEPVDEKRMRSALAAGSDFDLIEMPPIPAPDEPQAAAQAAVPPPPPPQSGGLKTEWLWNRVKEDYEKQFGENTFQAPKDLNEENEYNALIDFFQKNIEPDLSDLPEEIAEQISLHREGKYDPSKYFEQRTQTSSIINLPDKELLFEIYKAKHGKSEENTAGLSDDDIDDFLSKKSKIEIIEMAQAAREQVKQAQAAMKKANEAKALEMAKAQYQTMQQKEIESATKIVNQLKNDRDFFGIEFSQAEKAEFDRDFIELLKFNPQTGTQKLADMLSDHKTLYKIAGILWKGEGLRGYLTDLKEGVKKETERKLDPGLELEKGSTKTAKPVDRSKLV